MDQLSMLRDAREFSQEPEGLYFERKSARVDDKVVAKEISAMANAAGGKLVIGIENNGAVTGFSDDRARSIEGLKNAAIMLCIPAPHAESTEVSVVNDCGDVDKILVIDVEPSPDRVIARRSDKAVFLRQGDQSIELDYDQVKALEYDKNQRVFEDEIVERSSIDDVDSEIIKRYKKELNTDLPDEQVLRSRGFMVDGHLTNAGVILFCDLPTRFLPCASVRFYRYSGTERGTGQNFGAIKSQIFEGPLPRVIENAQSMVSSQLREFGFLGNDGKFITVPEYPEFAWLEGIVNAVMHRNYAISGDDIRIEMFDDRLEIRSPGKLPNIVTLDNMRHTRYARNPKIARALNNLGWVRELNEGVQRIYDVMEQALLNDPVYSEPNDASVLLTLENSITSRVLRRQDTMEARFGTTLESLKFDEIAAVQLAMVKDRVTTRSLAAYIQRSNRLCSQILKGLTEKGIMVWHGRSMTDPTQFYTLANE